MTNEEILVSIEQDSDFDFTPNGNKKYERMLHSIIEDHKLDLITNPTKEKMSSILRKTGKSLDVFQQFYLLPFLLMDFHRKNSAFLYDKDRLSNYLTCFWETLSELGCSRTFETYMLEKAVRLLKKAEGYKSEVLSTVVYSIDRLGKEYDTVQIAYASTIIEKLIRIQSLEMFHALDREGLIKEFQFEEVNMLPLSRLLDSHFFITERGGSIYKCLKKENKAFAFNAEFRKMSKDILVDRKKWSIRNKHIHASLDINQDDSLTENRIIRLYLIYFILKHNTKLLNWNWEYLEDYWDEINEPKNQ